MASLTYQEARQKVMEVVRALVRAKAPPATETLSLAAGLSPLLGRVLAEDVFADRPYPPFHRSTRDGYAVRAADAAVLPARLRVLGESKAGSPWTGSLSAGECVEIMTGAPVPAGADAVVMIEHVRGEGNEIILDKPVAAGQSIVPEGSEARAGEAALARGGRLGYAELALAAQVGHTRLQVYRRPRLAILSTGDEVVPAGGQPGPYEVRNSNEWSLTAQTVLAGAEPIAMGNARDEAGELRERIAQVAERPEADALIICGGVSAGKYDLVEPVLRELGGEFFFDSVKIRPGGPAVFAACGGMPVFGLPGNPISTMVTFELFVVPALDILTGAEPRPLALHQARLARGVEVKAALAHFLPARIAWADDGATVEEVSWRGSGDLFALARANGFLLTPLGEMKIAAGQEVQVLPRRGSF